MKTTVDPASFLMTCMKKRNIILILLLLVVQFSFAQSKARSISDFNDNWKFFLGDDAKFSSEHFKDEKWRTLDLPHDWSIEGEFSEKHPAGTHGGALPGGIGWYRKTLGYLEKFKGKLFIEFDGVYRNAEVWINDHYLGKRPNGYITLQYDLTPWLKAPGKNVIAVRVDNSQQPNSRWYSGSGIYRNVKLISIADTSAVIAPWGLFITTPEVDEKKAKVKVQARVQVSSGRSAIIYTNVYNATGQLILTGKKISIQSGNDETEYSYSFDIANPKLWSTDRPYLYKAVTR